MISFYEDLLRRTRGCFALDSALVMEMELLRLGDKIVMDMVIGDRNVAS